MSLTAALRSSLSGLSLAQLGLSVTSNNISNVNTPGYTRKIVEQVSQARSGIGSGVDLGAITRRVNNSLLGEMRTQNSTSYRSQTTSEYFTRLQDLFGRPGATSSLNNQILSLANAFEALGAGPENPQNQINTVTEAVNLTQKINNLGQTIQNLRGETDQEIVTMVGEINALLNHIHDLNHQIVGTPENSQSFADLEDQRDQALQDLSQYIDVSYFTQADGQFVVLTGASMPLVSNGVFQLAYTPQSAVVPGSTFNAITINGSNDLTNIVQNGKLKALIDLRDTELPNLGAQLDNLSLTMRDEINAVHNNGTSFPPRRTLTGTLTGQAAGTAFAGTGTVRIAVTNSSGSIVNSITLDLTTVATVGAIVTAINTALGADATASITAAGVLQIQATNSTHGIAINENTSDVTADGRGFSHHFGLNDFFVGADTAANGDLAINLAVNSIFRTNATQISRAQLSMTAATNTIGVTPGDASAAQALADVFTTSYSFAAAGNLPAMNRMIGDYSADIISYNATAANRAQNAADNAQIILDNVRFRVGSQSGVDINEEMANIVVLQNAFNASAQVVRVVNEMFDSLDRAIGG